DQNVGNIQKHFQLFAERVEAAKRREGEKLNDGRIVEAVYDETRQTVPFGIDDTGGIGGIVQSGSFRAGADGGLQTTGNAGFVVRSGVEGEHAEADRGMVGEKAGAEGLPVAVVGEDEVAVLNVFVEAPDHFSIDGGMEIGVAELDPGKGPGVRNGRHAALGS